MHHTKTRYSTRDTGARQPRGAPFLLHETAGGDLLGCAACPAPTYGVAGARPHAGRRVAPRLSTWAAPACARQSSPLIAANHKPPSGSLLRPVHAYGLVDRPNRNSPR